MEQTDQPTLASNVPPPPSEVKVRTMRSDIEGVAQAGGGLPQFKTVAVEGKGLPASRIGGAMPAAEAANSSPTGTGSFPWWIVAVGGAALALILWFGYVILLKK